MLNRSCQTTSPDGGGGSAPACGLGWRGRDRRSDGGGAERPHAGLGADNRDSHHDHTQALQDPHSPQLRPAVLTCPQARAASRTSHRHPIIPQRPSTDGPDRPRLGPKPKVPVARRAVVGFTVQSARCRIVEQKRPHVPLLGHLCLFVMVRVARCALSSSLHGTYWTDRLTTGDLSLDLIDQKPTAPKMCLRP